MRFRETEKVVKRIEVDCAIDLDLDVSELGVYEEVVLILTPPNGRSKTVRFQPEDFIPPAVHY